MNQKGVSPSKEEMRERNKLHFKQDFQTYGNKLDDTKRAELLEYYLELREGGCKHLEAISKTYRWWRATVKAKAIRACAVHIITSPDHTINRWHWMENGIHGSDLPDAVESLAKFGLHLQRIDSGGNPTWRLERLDGEAKKILKGKK